MHRSAKSAAKPSTPRSLPSSCTTVSVSLRSRLGISHYSVFLYLVDLANEYPSYCSDWSLRSAQKALVQEFVGPVAVHEIGCRQGVRLPGNIL